MSFILDALKKSETERQQQGPSDFANVPSNSETPGAPRWLWALGLLLAVNLVVLVGVLMRDDAPETEAPASQVARTEAGSATSPSFSEKLREAQEREPAARPETTAAPAPKPEPVVEAAPVQPRPQPAFTLAALPTADELQANGQLQMAELHLDIHVYSEKPEERFVFINMVKHREKSRLAEGPVVQEITPEGVILNYGGTVFLLPRE
jgi:general secretion pathway protein B